MRLRGFPALAVLGCLLLAGCGRGPTLYHVSGRVTYDGRPLPAGVIYFDPDVTRQNDGPQGYAVIKNGAYSTAAGGGKGVVGGPYVARIEGFDGRPGRELPLGTPLFTDFQERRELPRASSEQDFTVPRREPPAKSGSRNREIGVTKSGNRGQEIGGNRGEIGEIGKSG